MYNGFSFSKTTSGITFTYNTDGSIKVNGTATANATSMYSSEATSYLFTLSSGAYTLSGAGLTANVRVEIVKSNGTLLAQTDNNLYKSFTINENTNVFLRVYIASGTTVNNLFIYPMLNKGSTALPYEPYGIGKWYIEKNIGKANLEDYNWTKYGTSIENISRFATTGIPNVKYVANNSELGDALSNYYQNHTGRGMSGVAYYFCIDTNMVQVTDDRSLTKPRGVLYYALATPTYTEITDTYLLNQLNGILDIELYENLCYVDWVGIEKPTMTLKYNYDTKYNYDLGVQDFTLENGENYTIDTQGLKLILKSNDSIVYEGIGRYVYT